jgi:RNase P/RNase MRP subunit POP5
MTTMSRRYVLVRIVSDQTVTEEQFGGALMAAVRKNFGEIGLARIGPKLVRFDSVRLLAIIACKQEMVAELEAAVALIPSCGEVPVTPLAIQVSGTIKGLQWKGTRRDC